MEELCSVRSLTQAQLLGLKDKDLQKFLYISGKYSYQEHETVRIDNEEKLGYYHRTFSVCMNHSGTFYRQSKLGEWLVYNKRTKKVNVSKSNCMVFDALINDKLGVSPGFIMYFVSRATPTLCKKIIEGKLNTVGDIMRYHRSYTVRDKNTSLEGVMKFAVRHKVNCIHMFEDPENAEDDHFFQLAMTPHEYMMSGFGKIKMEDIVNLRSRYAQWRKEQVEKYVIVKGSGNAEDGNTLVEELGILVK